MKKIYAILVLGLFAFTPSNLFNNTLQVLPFSQNWTNIALITADDDWTNVPGIIGYRGDDITSSTGVDPQTLLGEGTITVDVIANQLNPNTNVSGGVGEFHLADPVVALQGSGTADAPNIIIFLNTTSLQNITVGYNLRDIDGSTDNAVQPVALQYRVGSTGNFTNVPGGFVADATTGPSLATLVTAVSAVLPAAANNQPQVQVRVITSNAVGNDEWVGIDDINIVGSPISGGTPDITLSSPNPAVPAGNITQGTNNNVIYRFDLAVITADAILNGVTINTAGTYAATDVSNFKCWYSADASFSAITDGLLSTKNTALGAGPQVFPAFPNQPISNGTTGYIFITADVPCGSVVGNNINVTAITTADISFVSGNKFGSAFDGGTQTIVAASPNNVTGAGASVANASSSLSWTNPAGCYDEVLIVAAAGATNSGTPTGDGTAYTGNLAFGSGTALGNGFVVYKGATSPQTVTNLTNGTTYFYKFFTRFGTTWSAGVEVSATPALVTVATDYFRSVQSGSWASTSTWESSSDSSSWIPATLTPGLLAGHVVIRSPDSVYLAANTTTPNLDVSSGAIVNALTFTMTITSRFHLYGTAAFYQGGTVQTVPGAGFEQILDPTSNYHFNGTQAGTSSSAYPAFGNLIWEPNASGNGTFQNSIATAPFNLGLVVRGNMTINMQNAAPLEIRFATGASITRNHTIDGNLNIISPNAIVVVTNGGIPVRATLNVGGNINISAGVLQGTSSSAGTDGSASLNLSGNINNTGGIVRTGSSTAGKFSLNYVGFTSQSINNAGGTFTFTANQLDTVNNTSLGVVLNTPITHAGIIRFIAGVVTTTGTNLLTMAAGSSVSNASNASYVSGPVRKIGNTDFEFPIGKLGTGWVPFAVSLFSGTLDPVNDAFTAEYIRSSAAAIGAVTAPGVDHVSSCDYWTLDRIGAQTANITAYWNANNPCSGLYVVDLARLVLVHHNGTDWNSSSLGFGGTTGSSAAGTITWPNVSTFSPFSLGSTDLTGNPLPITINYFNGYKQNADHALNWKVTCTNTPTATMVLERSTDGRNYSSIYSITATALQCQQPFNYTDVQAAAGVNYYRLKMTDANGKVVYSSVVTLINAVKGFDIMNIAPNPIVNGRFNLNVSAAQKAQMNVVVTDMQGRVMQQQTISLIAGFNAIPMNVTKLAAGTYQVYGVTEDGRSQVLRFVIQ